VSRGVPCRNVHGNPSVLRLCSVPHVQAWLQVLMRRTRDVHWMYHPKTEGGDAHISQLNHQKRTRSFPSLKKTGGLSPIRGLRRILTPIRNGGESSIDSTAVESLSKSGLGVKPRDQGAGTPQAGPPTAESPVASFKQTLAMPVTKSTQDLVRKGPSASGDLAFLRSDGPESVGSQRTRVGSSDTRSIASIRGSMEGEILGIGDRQNPLLLSTAAHGSRFSRDGSNGNLEKLNGSFGNQSNLSFWRGASSFSETPRRSFRDNFSPISMQSNSSPRVGSMMGSPAIPVESVIVE
jgi:hypothetical protein